MLTPIKSGRYISIKADGLLHEKVSKDTEGAVLREYELKDGTKGEKYELLYKDIRDVTVTNIQFEDSDFGENILVTLSDGENEVILAENVASNFGTDILKKLPNVSFSEKLTLSPYSFTDERGKDRRGVTMWQKSDKVADYFWDGEKKLHGFPEPEGDTSGYDKDDWKMYFIQVKKFLVNYAKTNIFPKFAGDVAKDAYLENTLDESPF